MDNNQVDLSALFSIEEKVVKPKKVIRTEERLRVRPPKHWHQIEEFAAADIGSAALSVFDISGSPKQMFGATLSPITIQQYAYNYPNPTVITAAEGLNENRFIKSRLLLFYRQYMRVFSSYGLEVFKKDKKIKRLHLDITTALQEANI